MIRVTRYLTRMMLFLLAVTATGLALLVLQDGLQGAFEANPWLNSLILSVTLAGILNSFRLVLRLRPEIAWLEELQAGGEGTWQPRLLGPLANMLSERRDRRLSLSAMAMRSITDGLGDRLQEDREISRYLVGLLIFLGLLGTFWGLLGTVAAVGGAVGDLSVGGADIATAFANLKAGLKGPLDGMGTAFSSSLFGLSGSLVLGFLDLQAGQAQNRFFNGIEDWLSSSTRVTGGVVATGLETGEASMPAYVQALLEQTAENLDTLQRTIANAEERRRSSDSTLVTLAEKISRLTDQMKAEQSLLLKIGENQVALQPTMARLAEGLERGQFGIDEATQQHIRNIEVVLHHLRGDLTEGRSGTVQEIRSEIKLLARTISALAEEAQ
jgi:hypothetical protein